MTSEGVKLAVEIVSLALAFATAVPAVVTYRSNSRRERAKWAVQLYEKYYELSGYRTIRELLDCGADSQQIRELVDRESPEFTDYLNFFELVLYLSETGQVSRSDVLSLFQYYLGCLRRHNAVMAYLNNKTKGFERLREFLNKAGF